MLTTARVQRRRDEDDHHIIMIHCISDNPRIFRALIQFQRFTTSIHEMK